MRVPHHVEPFVRRRLAVAVEQLAHAVDEDFGAATRHAVEARREYPDGALMAQIVGYTGPVSPQQLPDLREKGYLPDDLLGKSGVESSYETYLRGVYGTERVERNARGQKTQVLATETVAALRAEGVVA